MDYELIISERADELTERLTSYLLNNLKNPGAAAHFLNELDSVYDRLIDNPYQFPDSPDEYLFLRGVPGGIVGNDAVQGYLPH